MNNDFMNFKVGDEWTFPTYPLTTEDVRKAFMLLGPGLTLNLLTTTTRHPNPRHLTITAVDTVNRIITVKATE